MALSTQRKRRLLACLITAQNGVCCYCKRPFTRDGDTRPTIEHKKAKMDGGNDHDSNLAAACFHCNSHRGQQMVRDRLKAHRQRTSTV